MYKITNGLVEVPQEYHPVPRLQNSARGHPRQFQRFQPTVDSFKYAFLPRTIPAWNALPQAAAEADSLDIFKRHMSRHQQFWSSASCTMYIVHTCSTVHSFIPVLIYAPVFAVADHRGQDPASSVLSFEGRCYLSIQIQIQIQTTQLVYWHFCNGVWHFQKRGRTAHPLTIPAHDRYVLCMSGVCHVVIYTG